MKLEIFSLLAWYMHLIKKNGFGDIPSAEHMLTSWLKYTTADARLRIVSERVDIIDNLIISVSVIYLHA